jgi:uncharacterized protein
VTRATTSCRTASTRFTRGPSGKKEQSQLSTKTKLIVNLTRGSVICIGELADRPLPRMRGLIGRTGLPAGEGLLISPAPAIHTAFMRFPIDALFLDRDLRVVEVVERLQPWRTASKRSARSVLELSAGEAARRCVSVGDRLELRERSDQEVANPGSLADIDASAVRTVAEPALDWSAGQISRLRPLRILIASPDRRFRTVMSLLLARRNCSVITTANAGRVAELIAREGSDVVVVESDGSSAEGQLVVAVDALARSVGVVYVADDASPNISSGEAMAKWGPFDDFVEAIELADERRRMPVAQS